MAIKEEKYNVIDTFHDKLSHQINNVYTNFIQEVNNCVTILLNNANQSADILEDYLQNEIVDLKQFLGIVVNDSKYFATTKKFSDPLSQVNSKSSDFYSHIIFSQKLKIR